MFRTKDERLHDFDHIWINFVPKIVDEDSATLVDKRAYMDYSVGAVREYLNSLPEEYRIGLTEKLNEDEGTGLFESDSLCELVIGFKPDYFLLTSESIRSEKKKFNVYTQDDCFAYPTIDVIFKPLDYKTANTIVRKGIDMFFLNQADIEDGTIMSYGIKNGEMIMEDLRLLRRCLPKLTPIETRCNYGAGNGFASYLL